MKSKKRILGMLVLVMAMLASILSLTSCNLSALLPSSEAVSITKTEINEDGELIIRYSNGKTENVGVVVGKDGAKGEKGEDGADTSVRIVHAEINADGELIVTYTDGTEENLGVVVGEDGKDATEPPIIQDIDVTVEGEGANVSAAVAAALPSSVSVICNFTDGTSVLSASAGSGVFYSVDKEKGDAIVITNYHVVYNANLRRVADRIGINLYGSPLSEQTVTATFVGGSMHEDIAVLKVTNSETIRSSFAKAAELASSDAVHPGDLAIAIGNPRGYGISATCGTVNIITETLDTVACDDITEISLRVMRIDTAVNSGNSGGGLFDEKGRLIGIVNAKCIEENIENIGYALPIDRVSALVDNILFYCLDGDYVNAYKPTLGISIQVVDSVAVLNEETGLFDIIETVEVIAVDADSVAEGLFEVGDRFVSFTVNGVEYEITMIHHVTESLLRLRPTKTISFKVLRGGVETEISVTPPTSSFNPIQ